MKKKLLTSPRVNARSYSADSNAAERNSNAGNLPLSVIDDQKGLFFIDLK